MGSSCGLRSLEVLSPALLEMKSWPEPSPQQREALISRGKELLQKAMKNQDACSGSSILANARLWGVQILHVDEMLSYVQQLLHAVSGARKRCQKTETKCLPSGSRVRRGKLKPPFLKVEDQSRQFRPFHHQFKSFPELNFLAPKSSSPFEPPKSPSRSCRARGLEDCPMHSEGERSPRSTPVAAPKKKRGFCECCQETFEELQQHLQSPQHQGFALDDSQYAPVDRVISQLTHSFVQQSAEGPRSCLADERLGPQAQGTGGAEVLAAELGEERQRPEQRAGEPVIDTERDGGPETQGCSPHLPGDRASSPREGRGGSESCSQGLPASAGLDAGVCAAPGAAAGGTGWGLAPDLGWGTRGAAARAGEAAAACSEPEEQRVLGSVRRRKRRLSSPQSARLRKAPRLGLGGGLPACEGAEPVGGGPGVPGAVEAGSVALRTAPASSPRGSPADPASGSPEAVAGGFGPAEAAAASERGRSRASAGPRGERPRGASGNPPRNVCSPALESTVSPAGWPAGPVPSPEPPGAEARCCCSLCVGAAEKIAAGLPDLAGQRGERAPCPGPPQPPPRAAQADPHLSGGSSGSGWDARLLSTLTGSRDGRTRPGDRDSLHGTRVGVRDSGYASQLCSVLKQKSELAWAGKEDTSCRGCCAGTQGASFPVFEAFLGSWTS
ncbi:protein DBF4 homolog B isoform X2 [Opisthocomus hoazin]|uniref:protein DBF4 homolog B isoform X2 n=1 Tax=Opisthocomus hoazin TaxID=30419 RepID=UPI003F534CD0